jgi:hypothetical protein
MSAKEAHPMLADMDERMRATFLQEYHDECRKTAAQFEELQREAERIGDDHEARANRTMAEHMHTMARRALHGIFDEPETHRSFYAYDDAIADRQALLTVLADAAEGRDLALDAAKRKVAAAAMHVLTPMEKQVAEVYYVGGVSRQDAYRMLEMGLLTFDTHVRNISAKWKAWLEALTTSGVQPVLLVGVDDDPTPTVAKERRVRVPVEATSVQTTLEV